MDKTEKYLKSIDNTLSDILKELKHKGRPVATTHVTVDAKNVKELNDVIEILGKPPSF